MKILQQGDNNAQVRKNVVGKKYIIEHGGLDGEVNFKHELDLSYNTNKGLYL